MKFVVDAQLPLRVARWLREAGYDTQHTLELPAGNRTSDADIITSATRDARIVITKDSDFVQSFLLTGQPRILLISTGNISNAELESLLAANLTAIASAFTGHDYVELSRYALLIHQ